MFSLPPAVVKLARRMRIACVVFSVLYVAHAPLARQLGGQGASLAAEDSGAMLTITVLVTSAVITLLLCFSLSAVIRWSLLVLMAFLAISSWVPLVMYVLGKHTGSVWLLAYQAVLALTAVVAAGSVIEARSKWPKLPQFDGPPL